MKALLETHYEKLQKKWMLFFKLEVVQEVELNWRTFLFLIKRE